MGAMVFHIPIGKTYGRLRVIGRATRKYYLVCRCTCHAVKEVSKYSLTRGLTKSCGCYRREFRSLSHEARLMSRRGRHMAS